MLRVPEPILVRPPAPENTAVAWPPKAESWPPAPTRRVMGLPRLLTSGMLMAEACWEPALRPPTVNVREATLLSKPRLAAFITFVKLSRL